MRISAAIEAKEAAQFLLAQACKQLQDTLNTEGVSCPDCEGRGSTGREYAEEQCDRCKGYGVVDTPEKE